MSKRYVFPPLGTALPPKENEEEYPLNAGDQPSVLRWQQAEAQQSALDESKRAEAAYLTGEFASWLVNYKGGRVRGPQGLVGDPDAVPPAPPRGFMAVAILDPETNVHAWDIQQSGPPVCDVPAYDKIPYPQGGRPSSPQMGTPPAAVPQKRR